MRPAQQVQAVFIPQIDSSLKADFDWPLRHALQQPANVRADAKDFVNEIDVLHAASNQGIDFLENSFHVALAKFVAKESLVAERTCPRTAAGKFQLRANTFIMSEDMVAMSVGLHGVVAKIQGTKGLHVSHAQIAVNANTVPGLETAAFNFAPRFQ